ncbi:hypothetical protein ACFTS5_05855 [Nocardia sp. NPDC056952]|uniref:hypothetical protein n=1 Tax=Nocardia sp. NPDC056952 TaxID=3345979 RepID=UPI00362EE23B
MTASDRAHRLRRLASLGLAAMWSLVMLGLLSGASSDPRDDLEAGGGLAVGLVVYLPALALTPYVALIVGLGLRSRSPLCWEIFLAAVIAELFVIWLFTSAELLAYLAWLGILLGLGFAVGMAAGVSAFLGGLQERTLPPVSRP